MSDDLQVPAGDPNVIRVLQSTLDLARAGRINGVCLIGITPDGGTMEASAIPPNPVALHLLIGALTSQISNLVTTVRSLAQQAQPSMILRPR